MEKYIMKVQGCCCCFTLRTGTLILLWLGLIWSVWSVVSDASKLAYLSNSPEVEPAARFIVAVIFFYYFVHLVFLSIIPCSLGLYGIYNRRPSYLKPYIYVTVFELVSIVIACSFVFLVAVFSGDLLGKVIKEAMEKNHQKADNVEAAVGVMAFFIILSLLLVGFIEYYFLSVVYRYYEQLKQGVQSSYASGEYSAPPRYDGPMKA